MAMHVGAGADRRVFPQLVPLPVCLWILHRALNMQALVAHKQGCSCDHLHMQAFARVCSCSHVILSQQQVFVTRRAGLVDGVSVQRGKCMG